MEKHSPLYAYTYMFNDNKFGVKFLALFILTLACLLPQNFINSNDNTTLSSLFIAGIVSIIVFVVQIFYYGYLCAGIKSLAEQKDNFILPFFNFKTHGIIGLKCFVASIIFIIALSIILLIALLISGILYIIFPIGTIILGTIFVLALLAAFIFFGIAFLRMFAMTQDIFAFFRIKEIFLSTKNNLNNYVKHLFVIFSMIVPALAVIFILSLLFLFANYNIAMLIMCVVLSALGAYLNMGIMYIGAKCVEDKQ